MLKCDIHLNFDSLTFLEAPVAIMLLLQAKRAI
jgi:hypothetical protein